MCGICGWMGIGVEDPEHVIGAMVESISHRGPDDHAWWVEGSAAIGMSRLAIIDPDGGHQPRFAGPWCVVFNGEIYNHRELRTELQSAGVHVPGRSDAEVVAKAVQHWGTGAFARFDGMYAIAAYHRFEHSCLLARDPFGEKPLYFWHRSDGVAFASEPRAFRALGTWPQIDADSLTRYLTLGFVPGPQTMWQDIATVPPGHHVEVTGNDVVIHCTGGQGAETEADHHEAPIDGLDRRLHEAVSSRLLSDVDVGVLLSGGIDSSLVAWHAARISPGVRTFSVAVQDPRRDESAVAAAVAARLGTSHHVVDVGEREALSVIDDLASVYDEPFADSSAVPTLLLCRFAADWVKVALSGDGGDELFSGYPRHATDVTRTPRRHARLAALGSWATHTWWIRPQDPWSRLLGRHNDPVATYVDSIGVSDVEWARRLGRDPSALRPILEDAQPKAPSTGSRWPLLADQRIYLPADLLTKVDRASMSCGLEIRAPFLAPVVSDWARSLDATTLGPPGAKHLPRALLRRHLGSEIADRPKQGFSVPLARWLRGSLTDLVDLACDGHLTSSGQIDRRAVLDLRRGLNRRFDAASGPLWTIAMFELWHRHWL